METAKARIFKTVKWQALNWVVSAFFLAFSAGTAVEAGNQFDRSGVGTTAGQFLKLAAGARGAALGEAYSALTDDASSLYWNPAGITKVKANSLVVMHSAYLADTFFDYIAYSQSQGETGSWGLSVQYMNHGTLAGTDDYGSSLGDFSPSDLAITLGFACDISGYRKEPEERFVLGATGKLVRSKIINADNTLAADIGLLFPYLFDNKFQMSITAQNLMGTLKLDQESYPLPLLIRLGSRTKISKYWDVMADLTAPKDNYPWLAIGTEFRIDLGGSLRAALRGGFNTRAISDLEGTRNISMGMGLGTPSFSVDYAFTPFGVLGNAHRISMGFSF
ncbi:MAG: PorV/PorQ family protein [bacterium]